MTGYYLAHLFQVLPDGTRVTGPPWTAHVTLVPDFEIDLTPEQVVSALEPLLQRLGQAGTTVLYPDFFGAAGEIEVRLLEPTNALLDLHFRPIDLLKEQALLAFRAPLYAEFGYRPHLSLVEGETPPPYGQRLLLDSVTLHEIDPVDDSRTVVHTWSLRTPKSH